ncbi:NUDIX hydrolase [Neobacillus sp. SM06]|uniref:NUDIX hydrolase n=1 Tax=Neobacillus sp. SM06 TaxID=3422492 RepID=UPI003D26BD30
MDLESIFSKLSNHAPTVLGIEQFSKYAVLLPLIKKDGEVHVLFEVRSQQLRRQPGEVCYPGGRIDSQDHSEKKAAIRETIEELGLNEHDITHVYPLDFFISPFGMIIYPYVGLIENLDRISPNPAEVGEIFTVPLAFFLKNAPEIFHVHFKAEPEENFPFESIIGGQNYNWQTRQLDEYFYHYENKVIWGLTARILSHFIDLIR